MSLLFDITALDLDRSEYLASITTEYGLQNCHARAEAAYDVAPADWQQRLVIATGVLHADSGLEPNGRGDHSWLLWVDPDSAHTGVIDPTLISVFEQHGFVTGLKWELPS